MNIHWKKLRIPHLRFSARGLDKPPQQQYLHHVMSSSPSPTNNNDQSDRHSSLRESTGQDRDSSTKLLGGLLVPCHDVAPISIRAVTAVASRPRPTHGDFGWMTFTVLSAPKFVCWLLPSDVECKSRFGESRGSYRVGGGIVRRSLLLFVFFNARVVLFVR